VKHNPPHILLISPWITDFAAYNFWIRPLGLLYIAGFLRESGFRVTLIDCLDFYSKTQKFGDGKFFKTKIEKPLPLKSIPRNYCQYGIPEEMLFKKLLLLEEKPNLIGITSGMTHWYPGVFKVIEITKNFFKDIPLILGGIYAALCHEHAKKCSEADIVFNGRGELEVLKLVSDLINKKELITQNSQLIICPILLSTSIPTWIMSVSQQRVVALFVVHTVPPPFCQKGLWEGFTLSDLRRLKENIKRG
jgi:hypothetical protein